MLATISRRRQLQSRQAGCLTIKVHWLLLPTLASAKLKLLSVVLLNQACLHGLAGMQQPELSRLCQITTQMLVHTVSILN